MTAPLPLQGIKVLDFTIAQHGPASTVVLSDMGAEIWKVEPVGTGDRSRGVGAEAQKGTRSYFVSYDRGKKSITLNVKDPRGRAVALKLAEQCDVAVNNFRPGVMDRLGLGYEDMKKVNPTIIYAEASAFGPRGPMRNKPGNDIIGQAMAGTMVSNRIKGLVEQPFPAGIAIGDQGGAMILAMGILSGLMGRQLHGIGQKLSVSLYGSQIALQPWEIYNTYLTGTHPMRAYRGHLLVGGLFGTYETADGSLVLGGATGERWAGFCRALGLEHLMEDPRFKTAADIEAHRDELVAIARERFAQRTTAEWLELLDANDLVCAPVRNYKEVLEDEQAQVNGYIRTMDHPVLGKIKIVGSPISMSESPVGPQGPAPELGQHTEEILLAAGYTWDDIVALRDAEVICLKKTPVNP